MKRDGYLEWNAEAIAIMRDVVARWRATATDVQRLPQAGSIQSLPGRDFILVAPLPVLLFSSRKLGVTARLADLEVQAQGRSPRDAVSRLRRHLLLRYQELKAQPLQEPELWAGLQKIIAPRVRRKPESSAPQAVFVAVPPVIDPDLYERFEGFRETTLAVFTDPDANAALRGMAGLQYTMGLEYCKHWPLEPEGSFRHQARAAVADLRHLQGFLAHLDRERLESSLTEKEERLSVVCGRLSRHVKRIADVLEKKIGPRPKVATQPCPPLV